MPEVKGHIYIARVSSGTIYYAANRYRILLSKGPRGMEMGPSLSDVDEPLGKRHRLVLRSEESPMHKSSLRRDINGHLLYGGCHTHCT